MHRPVNVFGHPLDSFDPEAAVKEAERAVEYSERIIKQFEGYIATAARQINDSKRCKDLIKRRVRPQSHHEHEYVDYWTRLNGTYAIRWKLRQEKKAVGQMKRRRAKARRAAKKQRKG